MTASILEEFGYRVLGALTAGEAVRIAREHDGGIDLLLSDVIMPDMDGRTIKSKIEKIRPGIRTLFISGYSEDVLGSKQRRDVDVLQKPFVTRVLAEKVREVLDR